MPGPTPLEARRTPALREAIDRAQHLANLLRMVSKAEQDGTQFALPHLDRIEHVLHQVHDEIEALTADHRRSLTTTRAESDARLRAESRLTDAKFRDAWGAHFRGEHTPVKLGSEPTVPESLLEKIKGWEPRP